MITMTDKELFSFFQANLICESLTLPEVGKLMTYLQEKCHKANEVISDAGEVGEALGFVMKGNVEFCSGAESSSTVGKQGVGSLIGEMSFFDRKPRNLRMSAGNKGVHLLALTRPMYDRLKVEEPYIVVNILENAIVSLDHLVRHMGDDISALGHYVQGFGKR